MSPRSVLARIALAFPLCLAGAVAAQQGEPLPPPPQGERPVQAATAPVEATERRPVVEEITVTGSRVRRKDLTTPAPVTVISREQILGSGKSSIAEFLQSLPEQGNAPGPQMNNAGDGSASVNLRSLDDQRTLVLLNGRRFVGGGSSARGTPDLNSIPSAVVERIEVLKDGASAVYGQDAVAGVVNIITRRSIDGAELNAFSGTSGEGDGTVYDLSAVVGSSSERGSVLFSAGFLDQKPVWAGDRAWTTRLYTYDFASGVASPRGSSVTPAGTFTLDPRTCAATSASCQALVAAGYTSRTVFAVDPSAPGGAHAYGPADAYNFEPDNYLYTPSRRLSLFSSGDLNLGSAARLYFESSLVNRRSDQQLAPDPFSSINNDLVLSAASQYNPFGVDLTSVNRRLVEFGRRAGIQDMTTVRAVFGIDGALPAVLGPVSGWSWNLSYNYGRTSGTDATDGSLRAPLIQDAIGPSQAGVCYRSYDAATATYSGAIPGCVPLDLLHGTGSITPAQIAALGFYGTDHFTNQLEALEASLSGELFRLFADRPVGLALGLEHRRVSALSIPNPGSQAGESDGNNFQRTGGSYRSDEAYAELSIPVVSGAVLVDDLEVSLAARAFRYSTFGSDATYKAGARWRPVRDLSLRGTYSTAFRAPNIEDLYRGNTDSFPSVRDPCAAPTDPAIAALCESHGVPRGGNGDPRTQLRETLGGNPGLNPETARIFTVGAVLQPRFVRGLTLTVDYYRIDIEDEIGQLNAGVIVGSCYTSAAPPRYCDLIARNADGLVTNIDDRNINVGKTTTSGLDFAARYDLPTPAGRFHLSLDGTWLHRFDRTLADGAVDHQKGTYDRQVPMPAWKLNAGARWGYGGFGAGLFARHVGSYRECSNASGLSSATGLCYLQNGHLERTVGAATTLDASVSYKLSSAMGSSGVTLGMTNVFDAKPPAVYNAGSYYSDPNTYDFMGRYLYVRLTHKY